MKIPPEILLSQNQCFGPRPASEAQFVSLPERTLPSTPESITALVASATGL